MATKEKTKRNIQLTTLINDREYSAIIEYCKRYKIRNRSKVIREMVFTNIINAYERDYPSLFSQKEMADLVVEPR